MKKLNGWNRLGIVLTIGWIVCFLSMFIYELTSHEEILFSELTLPIGTIVSGKQATLPDGRVIDLDIKIEGKPVKPWEIKWDNEPEIPTQQIVHWPRLLLSLTLPFLVWAIIIAINKIYSWVKEGFNSNAA